MITLEEATEVLDVLLVDDDPDQALLVRKQLDPLGFTFTHAATLEDGLAALRGDPRTSCVLLDLSLPDADGLEGLERLRAQAPELPVVVLTGNTDESVGLGAIAAGAQDYLVKGRGGPDAIQRAIRYSVGRSRTEAALVEVRERFRRTFEDGPLGIALVDYAMGECRVLEVNRRLEGILGRTEEELLGRRLEEVTHWQDRALQAEQLAGVVAGDVSRYTAERRLIHRTGRVVWCTVTGSAVRSPAGELLYGIELIDDVTERKLQQEALREAHLALDTAILGIAHVDLSGICQTVNRYYAETLGYTPDELVGLPWSATVSVDDQPRIPVAVTSAIRGEHAVVEVRGVRKDGSELDEELVLVPNTGSDGALAGMFLFMRDVTERRSAQRALEDSEARYRRIVETANDGVWVLDPDDLTTFVNPRLAAMLGYAAEEMLGQPLTRFLDPGEDARCADELACRGGAGRQPDRRFRRKDGSLLWALVSTAQLLERDEPAGVLAMVSDITDRKHVEQQLSEQALRDELTGLPNRALLEDRLGHAIDAASRRDGLIGVLFLDLDRFKTINDGLGHGAGDELLRAVVPRLQGAVRGNDTVARFGGDEFVIVCEDVNDVDGVVRVADRILEALAPPFTLAAGTIAISASIGITVSRSSRTNVDDLLRDADIAMYRAKGASGARRELFDTAMRGDLVAELSLEQDLRRALVTDGLSLHFQPKVTLPDERIVGFEALVRWDHPERGSLPPSTFIRVAERSSLIVELGTWVLTEACRQLARWATHPWAHVAVNVSARQIEQVGFVDHVRRILQETGVEPQRIELEITERTLFNQDPAVTAATLAELAELGVRVVLDDFGTGYSSLSYLTRFPLAGLKLDRTFISDFTPDSTSKRPIVEAVTAMAHSLGLTLVGEGVETVDQARMLASLGCDEAQGYLFAQPMPAERVEPWAAARPLHLRRAALQDPPPGAAGWMNPGEAAAALGVSVSTLRRWADDGRIAFQRTAGGHRRFAVDDLREVLPAFTRARLNLGDPALPALPAVAAVLQRRGSGLVATVAARLYERPTRGWFLSDRAERPVEEWLEALGGACAGGDYQGIPPATAGLARTAEVGGASLLECSVFLERFAAAAVKALHAERDFPRNELLGAQRVLALVRRGLLEGR